MIASEDSATALERTIERYNEAWNSHDLDAIVSMHAPDMVFENHTAGESAQGADVRRHIASIFETWPDMRTRRLYSATAWWRRSGPPPPPTETQCAAAIW